MPYTDGSIIARTVILVKKKVKSLSIRKQNAKPGDNDDNGSTTRPRTTDRRPSRTRWSIVKITSPSLLLKPSKMATVQVRVCETELLRAADFIEPTSAREISDAITSTLSRGLTPLFNSYQIAKLLHPSCIPRSVIIDVRKMKTVSVDPLRRTLTCSAGSSVKDCDLAAAEHGLAMVGGTWSNLRMGGVALGGGYGWLSGEYGLVTDNLLSATVVLADGRVVTASEKENCELFWGIRGSYTNLGICADFTFRCYEIDHEVCFASLIFEGLDMLPQILEAAMKIRTGKEDVTELTDTCWNSEIDDGKTALSVRVEFERPEKGKLTSQVLVLLFHNGPISRAEEIFSPMLTLSSPSSVPRASLELPSPALPLHENEALNTSSSPSPESYADSITSTPASMTTIVPAYTGNIEVMPYSRVNAQLDYTLDHTGDLTFISTGFNIPITFPSLTESLITLSSSLNSTLSFISHAPTIKDYSVVLGIDFRHGRKTCSATNASKTAFAARFDGAMCYLRARWDGNEMRGSSDDIAIRSFVKDIGKDMRKKVAEAGGCGAKVPAYPGFCSQNDLEASEMFGSENYERLKALKGNYDPGNVFNGGFWKGKGGRGN